MGNIKFANCDDSIFVDLEKAKAEHEHLKTLIQKYDYYYYVKSQPIVEDDVYDQLLQQLIKLEKQWGNKLNLSDSPSQRLTPVFVKHFPKQEHPYPMLSLEKIHNKDELDKFWSRAEKELGINKEGGVNLEVCIEPKIDGVSLELIYENGGLKTALTRGDGKIGDVVTDHAKQIKTIPLNIPFKGHIVIRGEVVIYKKDFEELKQKLIDSKNEKMSSARNVASGTLHHQNTQLVKERKLRFIAYNLLGDLPKDCDSQYKALHYLEEWGFLTPLSFKELIFVTNNTDEIQKHYEKILSIRENIPFEMDGLVVKINSLAMQKELGILNKYPKWAVAYKFPSTQSVTKLLGVNFYVGKTGVVTPVAVLHSVKVGSVIITHANLHNKDELQRLDLRWGDHVVVKRSGDVIPKIESVLYDLRSEDSLPVKYPTHCPSCGELLLFSYDEVAVRCINPNCSGIKLELLKYWVSKDGLDFQFMGPEIVEILYKKGLVKNRGDFWALTYEDLRSLPQVGDKLAKKLLNSIEEKREISLERFIMALAIPHVGERLASLIANKFGSWDNFSRATIEELTSIPGVSGVIAESIIKWLNNEDNTKEIKGIFDKGVKVYLTKNEIGGKLSGLNFVITGELPIPRSKLEQWIQQNGGQVLPNVSKKTMFLLVGENPGQNKLERAQKILDKKESNLKIIKWDDFVKLTGYDIT